MKIISSQIRETIISAKNELLKITDEQAGVKPAPSKWSDKEVFGHLIDSASNNLQRFVRAVQNAAGDFPVYNQDKWVEIQKYNEMEWNELIELFIQMNLHICRVIDNLPHDVMLNPVNIGKEKPATLEFVITDYLRHLKHHLENLLKL